jgi:hypothetical protein
MTRNVSLGIEVVSDLTIREESPLPPSVLIVEWELCSVAYCVFTLFPQPKADRKPGYEQKKIIMKVSTIPQNWTLFPPAKNVKLEHMV